MRLNKLPHVSHQHSAWHIMAHMFAIFLVTMVIPTGSLISVTGGDGVWAGWAAQ